MRVSALRRVRKSGSRARAGLVIGILLAVCLGSGRAAAHAIPRLYVSVGPAAAIEPGRRLGLVGGSLVLGLGVDPEADALLVQGLFLSSTTDLDTKILPAGEFTWGAVLIGYRRFFPIFEGSGGVRPYCTLWLGGGGAVQGLRGNEQLVSGSLVVSGDLGLRINTFVTVAVQGSYSAPLVAAPLGLVIQLGLP